MQTLNTFVPTSVPLHAALPEPVGPDSRDAIVAACASLARDGGEAAVTMRAVALLCNTSPTELYRHFDGKEEMLQALQVHAAAELARWLTDDDDERSATETLRQICERYAEFAEQRAWMYAMAFRDAERPDAAMWGPGVAAFVQSVAPVLRRLTTPGRGMDVSSIAHQLWAAMHGLTFIRPTAAECERYVGAIVSGLVA
jgi:AcrR family transcriptional regulator